MPSFGQDFSCTSFQDEAEQTAESAGQRRMQSSILNQAHTKSVSIATYVQRPRELHDQLCIASRRP